MNPYKDVEESSFVAAPHLTYEDIATKLLKDNLFLTALELHTELVESGKELPQLREFFSNPGNFEQHVSRASEMGTINRTPSLATLDSLDTARYSEDGGGDRAGSGCDVAVLEFELRKARETINSLRANLTQFADESPLDKNNSEIDSQRTLKPHEKKALNFLINEYLLLHNYKLTSITFSDENPDQEFEDWDDVGLNIPRPANLMSLFWGSTRSLSVPKADVATYTDFSCIDSECQTDLDENVCVSCQTLDHETDWSHEVEEIELLKQKIIALETEKLNFQKLYDAAIVSLNTLTSPMSESKTLELQIPDEKINSNLKDHLEDIKPITCMALENHYGSGNSTHSATPEQFEMIYGDKNNCMSKKDGSNTSSFEPAVLDSVRGSPRRASVTTLDETLSINDAGEWTRVHYEYNTVDNNKEMWIDSGIPSALKDMIMGWCNEALGTNGPINNDLLLDLVNSEKTITLSGLLPLVADTLPRVLPHTLVSRRGEAAALVAGAAALLSPGDARRSRLLHTLLTLYKKPDPEDAKIICEATRLVVKWGGSGEVLSSIAELLGSRSSERRVLASQICLAIAPYVPIELCTSLLLSLVLLMSESSEIEVRNVGLRAAVLICPVAEHKYGQLEDCMFNFLRDKDEKIVKDTVNVFVPVLARSAIISGKFSTDLFSKVLANLNKSGSDNERRTMIMYLEVLQSLASSELVYVTNVQLVRDVNCDIVMSEVPLSDQIDVYNMSDSDRVLCVAMNRLLKEDPHTRWAELNWFIDVTKQILDIGIKYKALNHPAVYETLITLFHAYVDKFGHDFTAAVLSGVFTEIILDLENKLEKLHAISVDSMVVVGIYLATVLIEVESVDQQAEFLQKWTMYSSIRGLPPKILSIPLKWLSQQRPSTLNTFIHHLREFAASSCDSSSGSTIRMFIANLITEFVNTTDVNEDCIHNQLLPAVIALLYDDDVSVREAAITSWGSVSRSCVSRGLSCSKNCWPAFEEVVRRPLVGRESARAAEALAMLLLPTDGQTVCEKAVSVLCSLSMSVSVVDSEVMSSLAPALQLASHHCPQHPALLPALRKLEEIVQSPSMAQYKPAIEALLHVAGTEAVDSSPRSSNLHTAQEVGRRVTQIFQQSKTNINLPNIFRKKT
ncbi:RAB11-binding protein RELCH-like isoform X2 [Danaus plexippus]|uniref:RAB11-binding protein RELCH-like isoform X2 n=1 Tax=Danaus plexippus TaxID=13037 RepID=UPI002AB2A375|nr:RAB11-binding protein RELCH-like isoform X2 [Danaus plexippus]